jgi:hypothetical protein
MDANKGHSSVVCEGACSTTTRDGVTAEDIVRAQQSSSDRDPTREMDLFSGGLREWWNQFCQDALNQRQEASDWWREFAGSYTNIESWTRKHSLLGQTLFATLVGARDGAVRLTLEQQRAIVRRLHEAGTICSALNPEAFLVNLHFCPQTSEMARAWMMLSVATQARFMNAWAEFWSLPSSANSSSWEG